jgi:ABC-type antimicrobial peptide transport system permease subunit
MPERDEDKFRVEHNLVGPRYLETLQIPLVSGREFNDSDKSESPKVVIINQSLANRMFPNENAVGRVLVIESSEYTVIGVSKDAQYHTSSVATAPYFYLSFWQLAERRGPYFCVRTAGDPMAIMPVITREILNIDPELPPRGAHLMDEAFKIAFPSVYLGYHVLSSASAIACFLSMLGVYGIIAFSVVRRSREIGVRIALGATRWNILKTVIQRGVVLATIGSILGIVLAVTSLRIIDSMLYGVKHTNPTVLIAATIALLSISLIAGLIPAKRATRIDPIKAIRDE